MKNNPENIPSAIFDWLEKYEFSTLSAAQQAEVLQYFSREEYLEMQQAVKGIKGTAQQEHSPGYAQRRQMLMARFDDRHSRSSAPIIGLMTQPIAMWKAAAILLLVGSGWIFSLLAGQKDAVSPMIASAIDTVYITKEIAAAAEKVYDTIYVEKEVTPVRRAKLYDTALAIAPSAGNVNNMEPAGTMNVLSITELESEHNTVRGNSMKDDSLLKKYSFTTL